MSYVSILKEMLNEQKNKGPDRTDELTAFIETFKKLDAEVEALMKAAEEGNVKWK